MPIDPQTRRHIPFGWLFGLAALLAIPFIPRPVEKPSWCSSCLRLYKAEADRLNWGYWTVTGNDERPEGLLVQLHKQAENNVDAQIRSFMIHQGHDFYAAWKIPVGTVIWLTSGNQPLRPPPGQLYHPQIGDFLIPNQK